MPIAMRRLGWCRSAVLAAQLRHHLQQFWASVIFLLQVLHKYILPLMLGVTMMFDPFQGIGFLGNLFFLGSSCSIIVSIVENRC